MALPTAKLVQQICNPNLSGRFDEFGVKLLSEVIERPDCTLEQAFKLVVCDFAEHFFGGETENRLWDENGPIFKKFTALSWPTQLAAAKDVPGWFDDEKWGLKAQELLLSWATPPEGSPCRHLLDLVYPYRESTNGDPNDKEGISSLIRSLELLDRSPYL